MAANTVVPVAEASVLTEAEVKDRIKKLDALIDEAQKQCAGVKRSSSDGTGPKPDPSNDALGNAIIYQEQAIDNYRKGKLNEAHISLIESRVALAQALKGLTKFRRYLFLFAIYGVWPALYALVWFIALVISLFLWPLPILSHANQTLGVPAWPSLVAGIGAAVQIFVGVVADIRDDGIVLGYKRLWYIVLPFTSLAFGAISYMLVQIGNLSLTGQNLNPAGGNQLYVLVIMAFLAGYSTDWFIRKLADLAPPPPSTKSQQGS